MSFFEKFEAAINNKDLDAMMELMHSDWTMVMHSTGKVLDLNDWKEMFSKIIAGDDFKMTLWSVIQLLLFRMGQPMQ